MKRHYLSGVINAVNNMSKQEKETCADSPFSPSSP